MRIAGYCDVGRLCYRSYWATETSNRMLLHFLVFVAASERWSALLPPLLMVEWQMMRRVCLWWKWVEEGQMFSSSRGSCWADCNTECCQHMGAAMLYILTPIRFQCFCLNDEGWHTVINPSYLTKHSHYPILTECLWVKSSDFMSQHHDVVRFLRGSITKSRS